MYAIHHSEKLRNLQFHFPGGATMRLDKEMPAHHINAIAADMARAGSPVQTIEGRRDDGTALKWSSGSGWSEAPSLARDAELAQGPRVLDLVGGLGYGTLSRSADGGPLASFLSPDGAVFQRRAVPGEVIKLPAAIEATVVSLKKDPDGFWQDGARHQIDVTTRILSMGPDEVEALRDNHATSDQLAEENGFCWPYRVEIVESAAAYFGVKPTEDGEISIPSGALDRSGFEQCRSMHVEAPDVGPTPSGPRPV